MMLTISLTINTETERIFSCLVKCLDFPGGKKFFTINNHLFQNRLRG
uniref:Uncharacterized protein n=1 Tax=Anguilla anguilla TaxID=7936 RepID=A0A0E9V3S2_ANGAN